MTYNICGIPISLYDAKRIMSKCYRTHCEFGRSDSYQNQQDIIIVRNTLYEIGYAIEQDRLECIGAL